MLARSPTSVESRGVVAELDREAAGQADEIVDLRAENTAPTQEIAAMRRAGSRDAT